MKQILYNLRVILTITRMYTSLRCNTTLQRYFIDFLCLVPLSFCLIDLIGALIVNLIGLIGSLISGQRFNGFFKASGTIWKKFRCTLFLSFCVAQFEGCCQC